MILNLIVLVMLAAAVGFCGWEGVWSNALRFVNVMLSAIVASNTWPLLANYLQSQLPNWKYHVDFASLILIFAFTMMILRTLTMLISPIKVKFPTPVDRVGGGVLAFMSGWVVISFLLMAMHTAPLGEKFLFGSFRWDQSMVLGTAPDAKWLGFMRRLSVGSLGVSAPEDDPKKYMFDRDEDFRSMFAGQRANYESFVGLLADEATEKKLTVQPEDPNAVVTDVNENATAETAAKIATGMKMSDVAKLLGKPSSSAASGDAQITHQYIGPEIVIYVKINGETQTVINVRDEPFN